LAKHQLQILAPGLFKVLIPPGVITIKFIAYRVAFIVILMILFSRVKSAQRGDFDCYGFIITTRSGKFLYAFFSLLFFLFVIVKNSWTILATTISKRAFTIGWIKLAPVAFQ